MSQKSLSRPASLILVISLALASVMPVQAAPPSNDDFASAAIITEPLPLTSTFDTREATTASNDTDFYGSGPTVWYTFTPSQDMVIVADTYYSDYNVSISGLAFDAVDHVGLDIEDSTAVRLRKK